MKAISILGLLPLLAACSFGNGAAKLAASDTPPSFAAPLSCTGDDVQFGKVAIEIGAAGPDGQRSATVRNGDSGDTFSVACGPMTAADVLSVAVPAGLSCVDQSNSFAMAVGAAPANGSFTGIAALLFPDGVPSNCSGCDIIADGTAVVTQRLTCDGEQ